jgi:hypothetical protein
MLLVEAFPKKEQVNVSDRLRKARKNRKNLYDINDADLYKYLQLRTYFRYVFYHPAASE